MSRNPIAHGPWLIAIPALVWGFQLHLMELLSTVLFRIREFRAVWLTSDGYISYFWSNVAIACCLFAMATLALIRSLGEERRGVEIFLAAATLLYVGGFDFRLAYLGTHHLSSAWYAEATAGEPLDRSRWHVGVIDSDTGVSPALIVMETCEEVTLQLPGSNRSSRLVAVEEQVGRFSGERSFHAPFFLEYHDLCTFLRGYERSNRHAGCLTRRCS